MIRFAVRVTSIALAADAASRYSLPLFRSSRIILTYRPALFPGPLGVWKPTDRFCAKGIFLCPVHIRKSKRRTPFGRIFQNSHAIPRLRPEILSDRSFMTQNVPDTDHQSVAINHGKIPHAYSDPLL